MRVRMCILQPTDGAACPEAIEAFCTGNIGAFIEGAVAGENPARSKNSRHLLKRDTFIGDEMNCIAEESSISVGDNRGKILSISLNKFGVGLQTHLIHPCACVP